MSPDDYESAFADCPHLLALYRANENAKLMQYPLIVTSEFPFLMDDFGNLVSSMGVDMDLHERGDTDGLHLLEIDLQMVAEELFEGSLDEEDISILEQRAAAILIELHALCEDSDIARVQACRALGALN